MHVTHDSRKLMLISFHINSVTTKARMNSDINVLSNSLTAIANNLLLFVEKFNIVTVTIFKMWYFSMCKQFLLSSQFPYTDLVNSAMAIFRK